MKYLKFIAKRMLLLPVILYLSLALYAALWSDSAIFLPHPSSYQDSQEILKIPTQSGHKIAAIHLANPPAKFTLLVSHGNAEDLGDDRYNLDDLRKAGFAIFAYDYEGYGTSEGKPSEKAAYQDEDAAYDYLTLTLGIPADKIIIYGRSVGTGPAVHVAARRPAAGLILQSPFLSAFRVVTRIPLLPFDKFPNYKDIGRVRCPILIIHGEADRVIDFSHGRKLFVLANEPKRFLPIPRAGHNDLEMIGGQVYYTALQEFSRSLVRQ